MIRTVSLLTAALLAVAVASTAQASESSYGIGPYLAGQVGYTSPDDETLDDSINFAGALGWRFNQNFRMEGEVSHRSNDYSQTDAGITGIGDVKFTSLMFNGWYDFASESRWTPYLGGGAGFTYAAADMEFPGFVTTIDDNDTAFTWQLGAGVAYALDANLDVTLDYRFLAMSEYSFALTNGLASTIDTEDYNSHEGRVGLRYTF